MKRSQAPARARLRPWQGFAATALLLTLAPLLVNDFTLTLLAIYALLALSLAFVWGMGGVLCFGQAAFYGLGAYTYAVVSINLGGSSVALLLGVAVAGAAALALGAMMFYGRIGDVYLGVITLVFTLLLFKYVSSTAGSAYVIGQAQLGGFNGIPGFPALNVPGLPDQPVSGLGLYAVVASALLACWGLLRWIGQTAFGRVLAGVRENELRAELSGYDVRLIKTLSFGLGGAVAGLAGVFFACWAEIVTPEVFSLGVSAEIIIWVLVGGLGTLWGPMLGAVLLGALKGWLGAQQGLDSGVVMGLLLMAVVLFLPRGVLHALLKLYRRPPTEGDPHGR
jgi:ABC-type branched-subunit amino acid transport system permease subunit